MVAIPKAFVAASAAVAGTLNSRAGEGFTACSLANYKPPFPAGQTTLVAPAEAPKFVALAFGVQNYTCTDAGTFTAFGAVAELMDASCFANKPMFAKVQNTAFNFWNSSRPPAIDTIIRRLDASNNPMVLGQHYFVNNPTGATGINPKWDFTSARFEGNADAFFIGAGKGNLPDPVDAKKNVPWLRVEHVQGALADLVFRYDTVGGQPPASCTPGSALSVKYVSKYALYGGTVA